MTNKINGYFVGELEPSAVVGGCIEVFENAWPNPQQTISRVEQALADPAQNISWNRAATLGHGPKQDRRTNFNLGITHLADVEDNLLMQNIHNQFNMLLAATVNPYKLRHGIESNLDSENFNLLKYSGGQQYKAHYDGTCATGRTISAVCYLNNNFEGGELEFPAFGIKIKPQAGMLLLFPSNFAYSHIAHPVVQGSKYAIVTWIVEI